MYLTLPPFDDNTGGIIYHKFEVSSSNVCSKLAACEMKLMRLSENYTMGFLLSVAVE
jgi:hypothetical protein